MSGIDRLHAAGFVQHQESDGVMCTACVEYTEQLQYTAVHTVHTQCRLQLQQYTLDIHTAGCIVCASTQDTATPQALRGQRKRQEGLAPQKGKLHYGNSTREREARNAGFPLAGLPLSSQHQRSLSLPNPP
eukprot:2306989-Rhodomonas_salina.3